MGSNNVDVSRFVAVDGSGNVYTTGYFQNTADFDPGLGTSFLSSQGGNDIYISKLDANGNFVWARRIGGWGDDYGLALTLDNSGNVFVTGSFQGTNVDFDPGPGFFPLTAPNGGGGPTSDAFVLKLDGSGVFQWARRLGGNADDQSFGITLDNQGNVLTTGYFQWTADFDPGAGTNNLTSAGSDDIFVSKLNGLGNFVWARRIGGTNQDRGYALATDASTNIVVTGYFQGTVDFDPGIGTANLSSAGQSDIFNVKLNDLGNYSWSVRAGAAGWDIGYGVKIDASGNVINVGSFQNTVDFDPSPLTTFNLSSAGSDDAYIWKLDPAGLINWTVKFGSTGSDIAYKIDADASGNYYTSGCFQGTVDFDPGNAVIALTSAGGYDVFISKLSSASSFQWARKVGGFGDDIGRSICVDPSENVYITGPYEATVDFDPGSPVFPLTAVNAWGNPSDAFVLKLCQCNLTCSVVPQNTICSGTTLSLSAAGANTYTWNPLGLNTASISVSPATSIVYTVVATSTNGCVGDQTISIVVRPTPTIQLTPNPASVCAQQISGITATGASNYTWSLGNSTVSVLQVAPMVSTIYSVVGTNSTGCTSTSSVMIYVNPAPTVNISGATGLCTGQSGVLIANGANTYTWNTASTSNSIAISPTVTSTYSVIGLAVNGCSSTAVQVVTVAATLGVAISGPSVMCVGQSQTLIANGASSYTWNSGSNNASITISPSVTTTYTLIGASGSCSNIAVKTISVFNNPTLSISSPTTSICDGKTITLSANGANTYTWNTGFNTASISISPSLTTSYTVSGSNSAGCLGTAVRNITVYPVPSLTVVNLAGAVCEGNTITLVASGAANYTWTGGISNGFPFNPTVSTTYSVTGASTQNCTNTAAIQVTVYPAPVLTITPSKPFVCAGDSIVLTASGAQSYTWTGGIFNGAAFQPTVSASYSVSGTSTAGCQNLLPSVYNVSVNPLPTLSVAATSTGVCKGNTVAVSATGANSYTFSGNISNGVPFGPPSTEVYTVTGSTNAGCIKRDSVKITVFYLPNPSIKFYPDTTACLNTTIAIKVSKINQVLWQTPQGSSYIGDSVRIVLNDYKYAGQFTLTAIDTNGCKVYRTKKVQVSELPYGSVINGTLKSCVPFCSMNTFTTSNVNILNMSAYWSLNAKPISWSAPFLNNPLNLCFDTPGIYTLTGIYTNRGNGCTNTLNINFEALVKPQTAFSHYPESPEALVDEVSFTNLTKGNIVKSLWFFSKNPIAKSTQKAPMHTFQNAGINTVTLITVNDLGCSDTLTKNIEVLEDYHVYVPDVFTPNGDGLNDVFKPLVNGVRLYKIFVYNRSGKLIFSSRDETDFWDGTLNGNELEQGIYQWIMEVSTSKEEFKKLSGQVYLSR